VNTFELKIWDDEAALCSFYTVLKDESNETETDKFFLKYENDIQYEEAAKELLSFVLLSIGDDHGALDALFNRYENEVTGLPVQGKIKLGELVYHYPNFPLRLYALKITENIVVLFNGGIKDGPSNQTSSLHMEWLEACQFARRILEAIYNTDILIDEENRKLTDCNGEDEIIL
jgi:hypothetical protein